MERLIEFLKIIIERLGTTNLYKTASAGGLSTPMKETWEDLIIDDEDTNPDLSIGKLRSMLREIKSQHVFIKK